MKTTPSDRASRPSAPAGAAAPAPKRGRGRPRIHPPTTPLPPELPPPEPPERGRVYPKAPSHAVALEGWTAYCMSESLAAEKTNGHRQKPLAQSSVRANAVLWGAWCRWLAGQALHWSDATEQHVATFLDGPAPSLRRQHRRPLNPSKMSSLTRVRYFRVLRGVYAYAVTNQWIDEAPTTGDLQPPYVPGDAKGGVLPPGVLARLQNTRQLQETFMPTTDSRRQWWLLRDRAAVALVAECGITTSELIALQLRDLGAGPQNILQAMAHAAQQTLASGQSKPHTPDLRLRDPAVDNPAGARMPAAPVVLTVRPSSTLLGRHFVLPARVCEVLLPWVALREEMLKAKAASKAALVRRGEYLKEHSLNGPLFPSRQTPKDALGKPIGEGFSAMEPQSVYLIFKRAFAGLEATRGAGAQVKGRTAQGTSVIRNTLIQHWLRTLPEEEAQVRAGFKTLEGMRVVARAAGITTQGTTSPKPTAQDEIEGADTRIDKKGHPGQKAVPRAAGGRK